VNYKNISTNYLEGMVDSIIVSGTFGLNRDEEEKQIGLREAQTCTLKQSQSLLN